MHMPNFALVVISTVLRRGLNYSRLRHHWSEHFPELLLVFDHYEFGGFLPCGWRETLLILQAEEW